MGVEEGETSFLGDPVKFLLPDGGVFFLEEDEEGEVLR